MDSLTAAERETSILMNDEDGYADIWTAQRRWITALKKNPSATLIEEGKHGSTSWARFRVEDASLVSVRSKKRTSSMTDAQRKAAAERMRSLRGA